MRIGEAECLSIKLNYHQSNLIKVSKNQVRIGDAECLAIRISYTGELGWEIYPKMWDFSFKLSSFNLLFLELYEYILCTQVRYEWSLQINIIRGRRAQPRPCGHQGHQHTEDGEGLPRVGSNHEKYVFDMIWKGGATRWTKTPPRLRLAWCRLSGAEIMLCQIVIIKQIILPPNMITQLKFT